jgi:hypothetical protein
VRGHIRERSPGRWAIVLDVRNPETGKRKRKWHSFVGTKREAQVECAHSRVGITLDLYSHVLPGMQEDAAARIDEALRQALQKRSSANVR